MKSVRKSLVIAYTDIRLAFSERVSILFFFLLPILFTGVLGVSLSAATTATETPLSVVIVDEDKGALAREIREALAHTRDLQVRVLPRAEAEAALRDKEALLLLEIPQGIEAQARAGHPITLRIQRRTRDVKALAAEQALRAALTPISRSLNVAHFTAEMVQREGHLPAEGVARVFDTSFRSAYHALRHVPVRVVMETSTVETPQIATGFEQASAGQLVTWVLITLLGASEVFVYERQKGTLRRLLITPTRRATLFVGKVLGRLSAGVIQMAVLIGVGALAFGVEWGRSPLALALMVLAFGLAAVALGVALSTVTRTSRQASGATVLLSMLLAALGGAWWPLEITPPLYQRAVQVLPTTWAMRGFTDIILRGAGVSDVLPEVGILLGFAVLFFAVGIWRMEDFV